MSAAAEKQLTEFLGAYTPAITAIANAARKKVQSLVPGATELVYDNYNALVIGFGPADKTSEVILSLALYPRWVTLFFWNGPKIPDPAKLLKGSGKVVRSVQLAGADTIDEPEVRALIAHALRLAPRRIDASARREVIIKLVSATQRARRPT